MPLYTTVDEGYCVNIYTTRKALVAMIYNEGWLLTQPEDGEPRKKPTINAIRKAVSELDYVLYLYDPDDKAGTDWKYKVEIHKTVNIGSK